MEAEESVGLANSLTNVVLSNINQVDEFQMLWKIENRKIGIFSTKFIFHICDEAQFSDPNARLKTERISPTHSHSIQLSYANRRNTRIETGNSTAVSYVAVDIAMLNKVHVSNWLISLIHCNESIQNEWMEGGNADALRCNMVPICYGCGGRTEGLLSCTHIFVSIRSWEHSRSLDQHL